jgi:hypothetical protein
MITLESINNWIVFILGVFGIISGLAGFVYWANKRLHNIIKNEIQEVAKEFKPNGGSSLKDQVNRLEKQHSTLNHKVDEIYDLLTSPTKPTKVVKSKNS